MKYGYLTFPSACFPRQVFLVKENSLVCTVPLIKFSLVKSHLLGSWRASFSTSLTSAHNWKLGVRTHGRVSASKSAIKTFQGKLACVYGRSSFFVKKNHVDAPISSSPDSKKISIALIVHTGSAPREQTQLWLTRKLSRNNVSLSRCLSSCLGASPTTKFCHRHDYKLPYNGFQWKIQKSVIEKIGYIENKNVYPTYESF